MSIKFSQAYSIGKEIREAQFIKSKDLIIVPGPGQYSPSVKQTKGKINPSWSLSKESRDKLFGSTGPGPGQYVVPSKIEDGPKYIMGLKQELDQIMNKGKPGPGSYNPQKASKKTSYSISKRNNDELTSDKMTPGPGQYGDVRELYYKSIPGSKIGSDLRKSSFLKSPSYNKPGPGKYQTLSFTEKSQAPKFGFGSSEREKNYMLSHQTLPGPTNYTLRTTLGDGSPMATMPGRRSDLRPKTGRDAPGAGAYNPNHNPLRKSSPQFSLGKQKRDGEVGLFQNTPGCGSYFAQDKLVKTHSASWRIGSEQRPAQQQYVPPTPGPGQYCLTSTLTGPKFPIGSKLDKGGELSPGPGSYQVDHKYTTKLATSPQFSLGSQQRVMLKELNKNPGPGIYENKSQLQGPKFGFGSSSRMPIKQDQSPGPGSYKVPTQVANVPTYSMPGSTYKFA